MGAKYEAYIESEADGLDISVLAVVPDETPYKGILQLVHGMSEYKERYLPFMEYMAKKGYVCVIHDHRGHGKSVRALDDLGYMYGGGSDAILKDIEVVNREMHQQLPDLPLILFGHSMGSLAVRALRSDDASLQKTAEELRQMTDYMVFQIDEELRAREPLDRRRAEENITRTDLDSALRVASDIPNEIVYIMCRCIELMKEVVDKGDDLTACSALAAVHLSMAAIRCMQAELLSYAKIMDDDVFGYTIVREAELNLADHQELVDGLVEELTRRLTRAKK